MNSLTTTLRRLTFQIAIFTALFGLSTHAFAQIIINEIDAGNNNVEILNIGASTVDVSGYFLCSFPTYNTLGSLTLVSGSTDLAPGEFLVVNGHSMSPQDDELGLYINGSFGSASSIIDYVEWGSSGHARSSVAMAAGIWGMDDFVEAFTPGTTMMYDGSGNSSGSWFFGEATLGADNLGCDLVGDFNDSGDINTADLIPFIAEFGCMMDCEPFDLTSDGVVNTADLVILISNFGSGC